MEISETELALLSSYALSEMVGGLILGQYARKTQDPDMRFKLMLHCAEETKHGSLWALTIKALGGYPLAAHDEGKKHYFSRAGEIKSDIEMLTFLQSFERLVPWHFSMHALRKNCHPKVKETIDTMIKDEVGHLSWTKKKLDKLTEDGRGEEVDALMKKYTDLTIEVFEDEVSRMRNSKNPELEEFAAIIDAHWPQAKHDLYGR
jgi:hypothetical protein